MICVIPISIAIKDIDIRPAFTWSCHYYCPALLDAIYTTAKCSFAELQQRLKDGGDLLQWEATPEDYDANISDNLDCSSVGKSPCRKTLRHIDTVNRFEHQNILLDGGQIGRALLSQE